MTEEQQRIAEKTERKKSSWLSQIPPIFLLLIVGIVILVIISSIPYKWLIVGILVAILIALGRRKETESRKITEEEAKALINAKMKKKIKNGELPPFVQYEILPIADRAYISDNVRFIYGGVNVYYPWEEIEHLQFKMFMDADGYLQKSVYGEVDGNYKPYVIVPSLFRRILKEKPTAWLRRFLD